MNDLVSIIVPVYNVEQYLDKCVRSLIGQTYNNLEIVLVDDGSTDGSARMCDDYARIDKRVKVVHKVNGGLSSARNAGLDDITGDYVCFVDGDDYLQENAIETLLATIKSKSVSICLMKSNIVDSEYNVINKKTGTMAISNISSEKYLKKMLCREVSEGVCDKMFYAVLLKTIRFDESKLNEDFLFLTSVLLKDFSVASIDYYGYNYYQRANSITNRRFGKSVSDAVYNAVEVKDIIASCKKDLIPYAGAYAAYQARAAIIAMPPNEYKTNKQFVKYCNNVIKNNKKFITGSFMKRKDKLFCYLNIFWPCLAKTVAERVLKKKERKK